MPLKALDVLQRSPYPSTGLDLCVDMKGMQKPLFQCKTYGYMLCDHHAIVVIWQASDSPCYRLQFADLLMTILVMQELIKSLVIQQSEKVNKDTEPED